MAEFTYATAFSLSRNPLNSPSACSSGIMDDDDACSICLEPFTIQDPATVTSCKHEYHLQCILEWSQRSKECPICWQLFVLKDPTSQELLTAIDKDRSSRPRNILPLRRTFPQFSEDAHQEEDTSESDDSEFDERIMRNLAIAASRARLGRSRDQQSSSGLGPVQAPAYTSTVQQPRETAVEMILCHNLSYGSYNVNSPTSGTPSSFTDQFRCAASDKNDDYSKARIILGDSPPRSSPSETTSLPETIKTKWATASARYKESISKGTRGLKEKLHNCSVKELGRGVQREMSASIAGMARMMERLDISRRPVSVPESDAGGSSTSRNLSRKDVDNGYYSETIPALVEHP